MKVYLQAAERGECPSNTAPPQLQGAAGQLQQAAVLACFGQLLLCSVRTAWLQMQPAKHSRLVNRPDCTIVQVPIELRCDMGGGLGVVTGLGVRPMQTQLSI